MSIDVQHAIEDDVAELNTTINTTPLVDVMLVMLVIFIVTVPVARQEVPVQLPNYRNIVTQTKPENIVVSIDRDENVYFNNEKVDIGTLRDRLISRMKTVTTADQIPEVHIRGDSGVRFQPIGQVIQAVQQSGVIKVGFITEPHNG